MGWARGSYLFSDVIDVLKENVSDGYARKRIYIDLISVFEDHDCDTLDECLDKDKMFDEAYYEMYPEMEDAVDRLIDDEDE